MSGACPRGGSLMFSIKRREFILLMGGAALPDSRGASEV
jgi:hypothetical protein